MTLELNLLSALGLGLAGAGHCLGMCGGIAAALSLGGGQTLPRTIAYHTGRLCSYALLGGALGFTASIVDIAQWTLFLRFGAALMLISMGLYIAGWWRGMVLLERAGAKLWQPIQKLASRWLPVHHWHQAFRLGLCWGLMPCGLIYSSLVWAATAQNPLYSASIMFVFGLGTLPAMLATSLGAEQLQGFLRRRELKLAIAMLLIGWGSWMLWMLLGSGMAAEAGHMGHH